MSLHHFALSSDHFYLKSYLSEHPDFLIIQDLDGVCMGLVSDPLTRTLDADYLQATERLAGRFYTLTNGEHIGPRGINEILQKQNLPESLLPGLAAGGVQWKDAGGQITHPGVTTAEMDFLARLPDRFSDFLHTMLPRYGFSLEAVAASVASAVLDNPVSPTLNLNVVYGLCNGDTDRYCSIQKETEAFMLSLLEDAGQSGLGNSFFLHLAPNQGKTNGTEHLAPASASGAGTTDFQFMLSGALKEAGVLFILNQVMHQRTGVYPLGQDFNVRSAPHTHEELLQIAVRAFTGMKLPILIGVGDTVTSAADGHSGSRRGGSDRGFLTLLQQLGEGLGTDAAVLYIDSSGGEVRRPGLPFPLPHDQGGLTGISDSDDPLQLNFVFPGGHEEYIRFYCELAAAAGNAPASS